MQHPDWWGVAIVGGMYLTFFVVGTLASRRVKQGTASELIVAGRAMPLWLAAMTLTATWVDGGYLLGTVEYTYRYGLPYGLQGGVCFGISLILGGLFFAAKMRQFEFSTMIDPFEIRFGRRWAAVLFLPALLGELFWSGALLVAIGATLGTLLHIDLPSAIWLSAAVIVGYTMIGGMWSVAYTDSIQLLIISLGLLAALPFAFAAVGGWDTVQQNYESAYGNLGALLPPLSSNEQWQAPAIVAWWDMALMLMLGGIPWNCYLQRVLSCRTPTRAKWHSVSAGVLTILLTIPPALLGMIAFARWGTNSPHAASATLPALLQQMTPYAVMLLGLAAIVSAVTSSFSSSILSAGSMFSWNVFRTLLAPRASLARLRVVIRASILVLGLIAVLLALQVQSVAALWLFTADLVFTLLFPQLVMALYDPKANRTGSIAAFLCSAALRIGGGMSIATDDGLIGLPATIPYAEWLSQILPIDTADWYDEAGATFLPVRTLAALAGLILLPLVSRLTVRWDPPRTLRKTQEEPSPDRSATE